MNFRTFILLSIFAINVIFANTASQLPPNYQVDKLDKKTKQNFLFWGSRPYADDTTVARLRLYSNFARISFSDVTPAWNCDLCKKDIVSDTELIKVFSYNATSLYFYIAVNHNLNEILTVFRGTVDLTGWVVDFKMVRVDFPEYGAGVSIHTGFLQSHMAGREVVREQVASLMQQYPSYTLHVVGHSMGAALASLQAQDLARQFPQQKLKLTAYGLPRVGNDAYAEMVDALPNLDPLRFINYRDPIPHGPPMVMGYYHHNAEIWCETPECQQFTQCETGTEDWACSRHVIPDTSLQYHEKLPGVDF